MVYHWDLHNFYKKLKKHHKNKFSILTGIKKITGSSILRNGKTTKKIRKSVRKVLDGITSTPKYQTIKSINHLIKSHFHGNENYSFDTNKRSKNYKLENKTKTMAKIAKDTYNYDHKRGNIDGYEYISKLSSYDHGIYYNKKLNEVVIGARGTECCDNLQDLKADLSILAGNYKSDSRFKAIDRLYKKVKKAYPNSKIITCGHSLGGTQSLFIGYKHNITSYSFNPGVSSLHNKQGKELNHSKAKVFIQSGDPISVSALNHSINSGLLLGNPSKNPLTNHGINRFI